jgi:hypothetical protein
MKKHLNNLCVIIIAMKYFFGFILIIFMASTIVRGFTMVRTLHHIGALFL